MKKPSKRVKKTATVPSPAAGKRKRQSKADRQFEELIESLRNRQPWEPEPWTRDYEGEARRGANIARTRERKNDALQLIELLGDDARETEGAEAYAAECLSLLAGQILDTLADVASGRQPTPAADYAKTVRADLAKRLNQEVARDIKRRQRAAKGGGKRLGKARFSEWVVGLIWQVEEKRKEGYDKIFGVPLPSWPFAIRCIKEIGGQDVKVCWRNCLLQITAKAYDDERVRPPGDKGPWRHRQHHVKQIIDRAWREYDEKVSAAHKRWVTRNQTGDY